MGTSDSEGDRYAGKIDDYRGPGGEGRRQIIFLYHSFIRGRSFKEWVFIESRNLDWLKVDWAGGCGGITSHAQLSRWLAQKIVQPAQPVGLKLS